MNLKREFVHVMQNVEGTESMNVLEGLDSCSVTEYEGTVTLTTQTIDGLAAIIGLCLINQGEKKINSAIRTLEKAIVDFIG